MKFYKKKYFNLIEVALAIGILAIGMTSVLSLFPLGFDRTREAMAGNYCAEAADSLFSYISRSASVSDSEWKNLFTDVNTIIPDSKQILSETKTGTTDDWTHLEGDIYALKDYPDGKDGIFGIMSKTGKHVNFTGEALLWQSSLPNLKISGNDVAVSNSNAVGVNLEISWPVEKPYQYRNKNYYYFELYNNNNNS